jgi:methionyl-tRNA formyltransferase
MQILFAGTPQFSVLPLKKITEKYPVCGVLTGPDKLGGRGKKNIVSPVKAAALELGLKIYQPEKINREFIELVSSLKPDILVVAAYSKIFKEDFLNLFKYNGINLHPSLLPKFRGPSPIQAAILGGDEKTGITIQKLALKMDAGNILEQKEFSLKGDETTESLMNYTSNIGAEMLVGVLDSIIAGNCREIEQAHDRATYCRLIKKEDGCIIWENNAIHIGRMIRAYKPWPGTYTSFNDLKLLILKGGALSKDSEISIKLVNNSENSNKSPGYVLGMDKNYGILVKTGNDILYIEELQLQTKKAMNWRTFLNGNKHIIGAQLGG